MKRRPNVGRNQYVEQLTDCREVGRNRLWVDYSTTSVECQEIFLPMPLTRCPVSGGDRCWEARVRERMGAAATERTMKLQDVISKAMAKKITWMEAVEKVLALYQEK